ncbi:alpha/beta fold hydrolase [Paracoccus sp. S-4012]|uniref:alpha/beta hydrolase n=1 Tax=Paracoccus sp. S-4012 TaxID=2665648 RepID=UPI0012AF61B3|nr:alpha/beta hydrolase [Paracoccus sp. S-4012]MRX50664.1 alpha/beta fold hydrolase [Paracoccus sp. S-4012]
MSPSLRLEVLGGLRVLRGGEPAVLPPSKKTRALLAYLALTGRPHRRERLCEMFWDLPDDPRGSLRWALSKLRPLVGGERSRIEADRERVALPLAAEEADLLEIRRLLRPGAPEPQVERLKEVAATLAQPLLDGLDLPQLEIWQAWLTAEREEVFRLRLAVLERITTRSETGDLEALRWLRDRLAADPLSPQAVGLLARALTRLGRTGEAEAVVRDFRETARAAGLPEAPQLLSAPAQRAADAVTARGLLRHQTIGFCEAPDGVRIAYACVGDGPPLVKAANWLNHLELDWQSLIWGRTFQRLARGRTFIRYDERGNGLSDWEVDEIGFEAFVRDLETVADALDLERFPLLGMSQGCAVSIAYAVRHPERVSALILIGGYAAGWRIGASPEERERRQAVMTLTRLGWGTNNSAYRHIFSQTFMPDGTPEELAWFDEFQRQTTSPENAVRYQDAFGDIDVRHLLPEVRAPTLVLHARGDERITLAQGREVAIGIPGARFVPLDSRSHIILGHEPAWAVCMAEVERFLVEQGL